MGPQVADARRTSTSSEDATPHWVDDPLPLGTIGACDVDGAASDEPALLSENHLDSDRLRAAFNACAQGGLDEHDASAGMDVTSVTADGWYHMDP